MCLSNICHSDFIFSFNELNFLFKLMLVLKYIYIYREILQQYLLKDTSEINCLPHCWTS